MVLVGEQALIIANSNFRGKDFLQIRCHSSNDRTLLVAALENRGLIRPWAHLPRAPPSVGNCDVPPLLEPPRTRSEPLEPSSAAGAAPRRVGNDDMPPLMAPPRTKSEPLEPPCAGGAAPRRWSRLAPAAPPLEPSLVRHVFGAARPESSSSIPTPMQAEPAAKRIKIENHPLVLALMQEKMLLEQEVNEKRGTISRIMVERDVARAELANVMAKQDAARA